ncbi:MAG: 30S ribosomal protein S4 [Candidatus Alcyoniella australis]|nr:30S ribosomal protein S4 [Candidatus Alcyoniella australis]
MARYRGSVCRLCRRERMKLYLKGDRCHSDKCAVNRREYPPGQHGQRRRMKHSDYGIQLREKQKAKRIYGVLEKQFRQYFEKADKAKGVTGENLLRFLEGRLDNIVFRLGFSASRKQARQLVLHGHVRVNDRKVNIPSYQVREGDVVAIKSSSQKLQAIKDSVETIVRSGVPTWLELDTDHFNGTIKAIPTREDLGGMIQDHLIVELYSK